MVDLRQLRYFVAVAEELHFGRAAARLHMAQPPLSQQIRKLEEAVGVQLFFRTKRTVRLRPAGEMFLRHVLPLLADVDRAVTSARQADSGHTGSLALGFVSSAPYTVLPNLLRAYRSAFPAVTLRLAQLNIATQIESLKRGRIDLGVLRPPVDDAAIVTQVLLTEPMTLALPSDHPLCARSVVPPRLLEHEPLIVVPRDRAAFADVTVRFCHRHGFEPNVVLEATEMHTVIGLVSSGIGAAIVPDSMRNLQLAGVTFRSIRGAPKTEMALAWRAGNDSPTVASFVELARGLMRGRGGIVSRMPRPASAR